MVESNLVGDEQYEEWASAVFRTIGAIYLHRFPWMCRDTDATNM